MVLPENILYCLNALERSGYEAWVVGGCVRDMALGVRPHDWDICTSALPEQVMEIFPFPLGTRTSWRHLGQSK